MHRRNFIQRSLQGVTALSLAPSLPGVLHAAARQPATNDRVLIVLQLTGGNDGLNTVIPYADDAYYANRFSLAIKPEQVLKIDDHIGLHPALKGFDTLLQEQSLAVAQGVGYPQPNRSHFSSMDIWHTAMRQPEARSTGWLGRAMEGFPHQAGQVAPGLHLGSEDQPRALYSNLRPVPSVRHIDAFKIQTSDTNDKLKLIENNAMIKRPGNDDLMRFLQQSTRAALTSSKQVQAAIGKKTSSVAYPPSDLAEDLRTIAQLMDSGIGTRIYYLTLGGFDTHARQKDGHANLLKQVGDATQAFMSDLKSRGQDERALLMVFSEFGRRVRENATQGTDHGAAAPVIFAGRNIQAGALGQHPSLEDLDDGDLKFHTDFRQVYTTVLDRWLGLDSQAILGGRFAPLALI